MSDSNNTASLDQLNIEAATTAKKYMANFAWLTVLFVMAIVGCFILNLTAFIQGLIPFWLATINLAILTYFAYTPLHEAVHGNIHGKHSKWKWLNELCGFAVAPLIALSFTSHRYEHFAHHGFINQPGKDPDLIVKGMEKGYLYIFPYSLKFLWLQNQYFVSHHWSNVNQKKRLTYLAEVIFSLGWRVTLLVLFPSWELAFVIIIGFFAGGMFTAYWFAFRPHHPNDDQARYTNTTSLIMPKWMKPFEWFWLGQNLHPVHHLFPRVPFYLYHRVHREIMPVMKAHGTPMVGIFDGLPKD